MAKIAKTEDDYQPPASLAMLDGYRRLALRAVLEALEDFRSADLVTALDALHFLIDPAGAALWLDALGVPGGDNADLIFIKVLTNDKNQGSSVGRPANRSGRRNDPRPAGYF